MRIVRTDPRTLSGAVAEGPHPLRQSNWIRILVAATPLLLLAVLLAAVTQVGQAQGTAPAQPTGLTAAPSVQQAALTWDEPSDGSITGYEHLAALVTKLTASDGAANDHFGKSVAVDGDTAVVGAAQDDNGKGAAYVLTKQSGVWSQVAKLTAFDGAANDYLGWSVAMEDDTVVLGAYNHDSGPGAGSGAAYVFTKPTSGGWVTATETAKLTAFDGAAGDTFGVAVGVNGDTVVVGALYDDDNGADSGAAYVFTKPTSGGWADATETAKLTALEGAPNDQFGIAVGVDGDTVVVGAWKDDDGGAISGSAYVFTKPTSGGWVTATETAQLTALDAAAYDNFGVSVAVDGDTVVVGAYQADNGGASSGSAYVFTEPNSGWATANETAKLTASDRADDDYFGWSVAVDGDAVVVGSYQDDDNGADSGSAYLFTKPNGGWADATETAKLTASDGAASDQFGIAVAVDGGTVVVGSNRDDDNGSGSGSAYVYEVSDWTAIPDSATGETNATSYTVTGLTGGAEYSFWVRATNSMGAGPASDAVTVMLAPAKPTGLAATAGDTQATLTWDDPSDSGITEYEFLLHREVAKLTASDGIADDQLGWSVAVDGDTAVVSAYRDESFKGAAYVFTRESATWSQVAKLTVSDGAALDAFGWSVAVDGDTVVVGAYRDDDNGVNSGSAYVFTKPNTGWADATETAQLTASDGADDDEFGHAVAMDGDTVVVGADGNNDDEGAVYVFTKPNTGWADATQTAKLTASDGAAGDHFGTSVGVDGGTVVVGFFMADNEKGSVYVFTKPTNGGWSDATETAKLTASDGAANDYLGVSVAVDGDTVVVGAWFDDDNGRSSGSAYVFTEPASGGWSDATETAKLTASDGAANDYLGVSVAVDGDTVVVGAWFDDDNGASSGSAYVFTEPPSGGWSDATETAKLTASDGATNDGFGTWVAVDDDTVVVGAPHDDDNGGGSGSAYLYEVSGWTSIPNSASGGTNATSYTVTGLTNDAEYYFRIRAENTVGAGPASDAVNVTPAS